MIFFLFRFAVYFLVAPKEIGFLQLDLYYALVWNSGLARNYSVHAANMLSATRALESSVSIFEFCCHEIEKGLTQVETRRTGYNQPHGLLTWRSKSKHGFDLYVFSKVFFHIPLSC